MDYSLRSPRSDHKSMGMIPMTNLEKRAWAAYCEETRGSMHVADFWSELPESVQKRYLDLIE